MLALPASSLMVNVPVIVPTRMKPTIMASPPATVT